MRAARFAVAAALVLSLLPAPALAAKRDDLVLSYTTGRGGSAVLSVEGLDGVRDVYAVQAELTLKGSYSEISLKPSDKSLYAPQVTVETSGKTTLVTLYLYGEEAINRGTSLDLGTLDVEGGFSAVTSAKLTLLDWTLSPFEYANGQAVAVRDDSEDRDDKDEDKEDEDKKDEEEGTDEDETLYPVSVGRFDGGTVRVDPTRAIAGDWVSVTATPDLGFQMDNLAVWDDDGNSVRLAWQAGDRYTFQMPASRVTVEAAFSAKSGAANTLPFTDVAGNAWYHAAVEYVYGGGLMSGTDGTHFSPNVTTTRGMIVTILHSMAGRPGAAGSAGFLDVPAGQYYTAAVEWACASGVVSGYPDGRFRPNDPITREQFAAILYRYAQLSGRDTGAAGDLSAFQDRGKVSAYAVEAVGWAVEQGLISGMGDGNLAPGGSATRAQAAAMLTKYCESTPGV